MKRCYILLAWMLPACLLSQNPSPVDTLNYAQVFLEVPPQNGIVHYEFHLIDTDNDKEVIMNDSLPAVIADNLEWGHTYEWFAVLRDDTGKPLQISPLSSFYLKPPQSAHLQKIHTQGKANWEGLLFLDMDKIAVDQDGKLIWYYPENKSKQIRSSETRDLELLPGGDLSIIAGANAFIFDLKGNITYEFPKYFDEKGEEETFYHHEIVPAEDGTFFILGKEMIAEPENKTTSLADLGKQKSSEPLGYSVIYQFNRFGELLWKWSSSGYFPASLLEEYPVMKQGKTIGHMNSLDVSSDGKRLLVGFRNLDKLLLISYPDGNVVMSIGNKLPMEKHSILEKTFSRQHAAIFANHDTLLLFNNSNCGLENQQSSIQMIKINEQNQEGKLLLDIVPVTEACADRLGNVLETESGNYLVNMGTIPEVLEIDKKGKKTWSMEITCFDSIQNTWKKSNNYRIFHSSSLFPYRSGFSIHDNFLSIYNTGTEPQEYIIYDRDKNESTLQIKTDSRSCTKINLKKLPDNFQIISTQTKKAQTFRQYE